MFSKSHHGRWLPVLVALFLTFDFVALSLNVWLSYRIEQAAININLAGRQRMLSQRLVKSLLFIEREVADGAVPPSQLITELQTTYTLFDITLKSFQLGGETVSAKQVQIEIDRLESERAINIIEQAFVEWAPLKRSVEPLVMGNFDVNVLNRAIDEAKRKNQRLLVLMNALTIELEQDTQAEARAIRFFQGLAFFLALVNFAIAMLVFQFKLKRIRGDADLIDNIMNKVATGVLVVDESGTIIRANKLMASLSGFSLVELLSAKLQDIVFEKDNEFFGVKKSGEHFHCLVEQSRVTLHTGMGTVYTVFDNSQLFANQQALAELAYQDQLTEIPNRHLFNDRLSLELAHSERRNESLALLFIDLNDFKQVNDRYGHTFGDLVLSKVASRMKRSIRESDTVARLGGDEFTILLTNVYSKIEGKALIGKILQSICEPYTIEDTIIRIGASIGVAFYPEDATQEQDLLAIADSAMYLAKSTGEDRVIFASELSTEHTLGSA